MRLVADLLTGRLITIAKPFDVDTILTTFFPTGSVLLDESGNVLTGPC